MSHNPSHLDLRRDIVGIGLAAVAALTFATMPLFAKFAFRDGADTVPLLTVRFLIAAGFLATFRTMRAAARPTEARKRSPAVAKLLLLGAVGYGFEATLFFVALEHAPAGTVALIFYSFPLWTTILSISFGIEAFKWTLVAALGLGSIGVSIVFTVDSGGLLGPSLALGAALAVAVYFTFAQVVAKGMAPELSALWTALGAATSLGVVWAVTGQNLPLSALGPAIALGAGTAIAFAALFGSIDRIGSSRSSVAAMLEPVATVALGALFLDEVVSARILIGAALIVAALPVLAATGRHRPVAPAPDSL